MSLLLKNGSTLAGRYIIEGVLGQGGMGAVYLVSDVRIPDKKWAVKELWDFGDPDTRQLIQSQFKKEASILGSLDHKNLPRITDFFVDSNKEYLVMDYIEGCTLEEFIKKQDKPLPVDMTVNILMQLMDVLEYLHSQSPPIIFRDLKPANVMIKPDGDVKLIDFGIARIFSAGKQKDTIVMGTPGFAAPEQYGTRQSDARSDVYGLGAVIYFLLTMQDPADDPFKFDPPSKYNSQISKRLENALLKCVQMDPEHRFGSVAELRKYLFGERKDPTSELLSLLEGSKENESISSKIKVNPEALRFNPVRRGAKLKGSFQLLGNVPPLKAASDSPWIQVQPSKIRGINPVVNVTVNTKNLTGTRTYKGGIILKGSDFSKIIPVYVDIEAKQLGIILYLLTIAAALLSFVPILGYMAFLFNLLVYFGLSKSERSSIKIFFFISVIMSLLWTLGIGTLIALQGINGFLQ